MCDNVGDHLIGNVYARFDWEDEAQRAVEELNKRWYAGESRSDLVSRVAARDRLPLSSGRKCVR